MMWSKCRRHVAWNAFQVTLLEQAVRRLTTVFLLRPRSFTSLMRSCTIINIPTLLLLVGSIYLEFPSFSRYLYTFIVPCYMLLIIKAACNVPICLRNLKLRLHISSEAINVINGQCYE